MVEAGRAGAPGAKEEARRLWLRRQAIQLAGQLPENPEDAFEVLRLMGELMNTFLMAVPSKPSLQVIEGSGPQQDPG